MVAITNDTVAELHETVTAVLNNPSVGGTLATAAATATILDNDQSIWDLVGQPRAMENGGFMEFTIGRTGNIDQQGTVRLFTDYRVAASDDWANINQLLTFAAGEAQRTVRLPLIDDNHFETQAGQVQIRLADASSGSTLLSTTTTLVSQYEDEAMTWAIRAVDTTRAEDGGVVIFEVTRDLINQSVASTITLTIGGTATNGVDYTGQPVTQVLSFAAGESAKWISINTVNDALAEGAETIVATLSGASVGSTIATASTTVNLIDNDSTSWEVTGAAAAEEAGYATYNIRRITGVLQLLRPRLTLPHPTARPQLVVTTPPFPPPH